MTAPDHHAAVHAHATPAAAPRDLASWNRSLNRTHAMADMRARAGRLVTALESRRRRLVGERIRRLRPRCVVDVGCEDGWIAEGYVEAVEALVLVDVDPAVLASTSLAAHPKVRTVTADALSPGPILDAVGAGGADIVVLSALLEHLPHPAEALEALEPLLAPGGRFVIYVPADGPILFAKTLLRKSGIGEHIRGLSLEPAPGHLHRFDRRRLARLLQPHGTLEEIAFDPLCLGYVAVVRSD